MATPRSETSKIQIIGVNDVKKCRRLMERLLNERQTVAVDAEGVSLSKTGRLTLLQFGTMDGSVFLIDVIDPHQPKKVQKGKELLIIGKVKDVLESSRVEKVMHGCVQDSAALYHQFGIKLNNVFDTQIADVTLEQEVENVSFPRKLRLDLLAKKYTGVEHQTKKLKVMFAIFPNFWEERPLDAKKKKYAAEDVTILLPGLYDELKRRIDRAQVWDSFNEAVQAQILENIDPLRSRMLRQTRNARVQRNATTMRQQRYGARRRHETVSTDLRQSATSRVPHSVLSGRVVPSTSRVPHSGSSRRTVTTTSPLPRRISSSHSQSSPSDMFQNMLSRQIDPSTSGAPQRDLSPQRQRSTSEVYQSVLSSRREPSTSRVGNPIPIVCHTNVKRATRPVDPQSGRHCERSNCSSDNLSLFQEPSNPKDSTLTKIVGCGRPQRHLWNF